MAKRLTEEMVIARTKISDLSKIKRLNCWGSELVDVSLLRKMPCVEVLSLSINKINSLVDFQFCKRLEELFIRQNDIRDLNEIIYLQNLTNLKNLWLGENPCAKLEGYRLSVIKALPQLQKLDNVQITPDEVKEAQRRGKGLCHPDDAQDESEEEFPQQQYNRYQEPETDYTPVQRSPPRQDTEFEMEESEDVYPREDCSEESRDYSPPRQPSPPRRTDNARRSYSPPVQEYTERRRDSYERESPKQYYEKSTATTNNSFDDHPSHESNNYRETKIVNSQSTSCIKEYANGERYVQSQPIYRQNENSETQSNHGYDKRERFNCPAASHRPPFSRRPVTRNSNILSAVLCLVKELDYPSLEVVEMAVRCRMDELDE